MPLVSPEDENHCQKCDKPDTADNMVGCDACETWEHFGCAGVSDSIADPNRSWRCEKCRPTALAVAEEEKASSAVTAYTSASSKRSRRAQLQLELLEQQNKLKMKRLEEEEKYLKEKFDILMQLEEEEDLASNRSNVSAKSKQQRLEKWLEDEAIASTINNMDPRLPSVPYSSGITGATQGKVRLIPTSEAQSVSRKLEESPVGSGPKTVSTPAQLKNPSVSMVGQALSRVAPPAVAFSSRTFDSTTAPQANNQHVQLIDYPPPVQPTSYLPRTSANTFPWGTSMRTTTIPTFSSGMPVVATEVFATQGSSMQKNLPMTTMGYEPIGRSNVYPFPSTVPSWNPDSVHLGFEHVGLPSATLSNNRTAPVSLGINPYGPGNSQQVSVPPGPNASQIAARQVMSRDLPIFSGVPEEWPIFYSSFKNSTEVCGYCDAENLARLQRCLRGNALEAVRSRLLLPSSVPSVMETLRMLYGRPELLINSLLKRVRAAPAPKADNLRSIVDYGLAVQNLIDHMIIAEQQNHLTNPMLLNELVEKLPTHMKLQWGSYKQSQTDVNLATFNHFMSNLVGLASDLMLNTESLQINTKESRSDKHKEKLFIHTQESSNEQERNPEVAQDRPLKGCTYCEDANHQIVSCQSFKALDIDARWKAIRQKNLCRTCLVPHRKWPCRSKKECGLEGCRSRHHQLLHAQYAQQTDQVLSEVSSSNDGLHAHQNHHCGKSYSLFRYLPVKLFGNGKVVNIFAFLDEGSSLTLLEAEVAEQLGIDGPSSSLWLSWTGKISREEKGSKRVSLTIAGESSHKKYPMENVQTVDELNLPKQTFNYEGLADQHPHLRGLPLQSYSNIVPRMIIGLEHVRLLTALKTRERRNDGLIAVKTRLGWCALGKESDSVPTSANLNFHYVQPVSNQSLHDMMRSYFAVEESAVTKKLEGEGDKRALQILEQTTVRKGKHYETGLLWRVDDPVLPDSLPMAKGRLKSLEKRLARNPELAAKVNEQIESYVKKGYAHKATKEELEQTDHQRVWYLPLGVVVNPRKPGKIRLIWDAAAKVEGVSFNDLLLKGPDLLTSLVAVILRFRERNVAVCGDICEMFHQIWIRVNDTKFQRFLWRSSPDGNIEIYIMDVATFGATCSPCSAQFIKNKNAEEYATIYPRAVEAITKNHYVDDFLDSMDTVDEAVQLVKEVKTIHAAAGFEIHKFRSNVPEVLAALGEPEASTSDKPINSDKQVTSERVLGLIWDPIKDVFTFDASGLQIQQLFNGTVIPTKRQVLQMVMKLFDPLGFISHYTIHGKILMQEIWRSGTNWDEPIAENLLDMWYRWSELLALIGEVQVPRCYFGNLSSESLRELQVHVFVDASESAYACVAYLRLRCAEGTRCALVASKTKVAPLKPLSIPRLELQAAMIGARLMQTVCSSLTLPINKRFLWSDSTTVLAWLRSDSRRYHQFVGFRVGEILSLSSLDQWRYVPSGLNVADEATKWVSGPTFAPDSRWFKGPEFLTKEGIEWPVEVENPTTTSEELRPVFLHQHNVMEKLINECRFSNWNRLVRAMAYVHRAVTVLKKRIPAEGRGSVLQRNEIQEAEYTVLRQAQAEAYPDELASLVKQGTIAKSSTLYQLTPFLDDHGIIRMGSRIAAAPEASYSTKYPVILPKKHHVTTLLIDNFHRRFLHANHETVHNEMRQQYYISGLRTLIRKVARGCQLCKVNHAVPKPPMMAPLPSVRLTPFVRAFTYVGVDYFGPLEVKVGRSLVKRWIALFTCLTVRAVHLEVTHSLSSKSCIMAFRRFVARRGAPLEVYSDNGTNFVGANRQLSEEQQKIRDISQECASTFTNAYTTWHFNVPAAPHMGGPWERLVRSVKTAMKTISDSPRYPSDEVLETILLEAEGVVNSRPLTYLPLEQADDEALTPNHFLLYGSSGVKQPETALVGDGGVLRDSWKLTQHIVDGFWRRWVREYLPMLTRRTKWFEKVKPLEPGDLVIVIDENVRNSWTRGRILETTKGADNQVRRATVQTARGIISRPAVKLALLDVRKDQISAEEDGRSGTGEAHGWGDVAVPTVRTQT